MLGLGVDLRLGKQNSIQNCVTDSLGNWPRRITLRWFIQENDRWDGRRVELGQDHALSQALVIAVGESEGSAIRVSVYVLTPGNCLVSQNVQSMFSHCHYLNQETSKETN
jgi:hypothetical protein